MTTEALYAEFFGLRERPFNLLPDPALIYWSPQHTRAITVLRFGLMSRAPVTLISGEIGAGKTTLVQALLKEMDADLTVGLISNAQGGRGELLRWILNAFGIEAGKDEDYVRLFQRFQDFLLKEYAEGRRVVLVIDEAQNLSSEGLEEVRMLTNINSNKDELIQLILVGQPELRDIVRAPNMRQLAQRVAASFHLERLDLDRTRDYIRYRLQSVGGTGDEISPGAVDLIFEHTGGVPRLVNQLADFAMIYAWSGEQHVVTPKEVQSVLDDGVFFGDITTGAGA
ncbi:ExeA family protein [Paenirhodobacter populi]|uniref:AAA family ATPase n=1 Tax=Paenirhodobacter populi TaxID=2306993 RepID=A0A443IP56_9RHOB|nr:AAA family ATPase [Sinirhodobacter populi]RWR08128.1 AAA family ATPase [Sinirhodobacter populi]